MDQRQARGMNDGWSAPRCRPGLRMAAAAIGMFSVPAAVFAQPLCPLDSPQRVRYDGQMLVTATIRDSKDLMLINQVSSDCWSHSAGPGRDGTWGTLDYRVDAAGLAALRGAGMDVTVVVPDMQATIDEEVIRLSGPNQPRGWFDDYKNADQVSEFVNGLVAARPDLASREQVGLSLEGRELYAIRLSAGPDPAIGFKPTILLNSVQHAREWISVMTTMYLADQLLAGYGTEPRATALLDRYQVLIVPIVNADGYQYTWTNDRFWRKNRRHNADNTIGVDNNRNWSFAWGSNNGSSGNGFSETFRGAAPFSEPETAAMRDFTFANPGIVMHLDVHSYGPLLLYPWGYTPNTAPALGAFQRLTLGMRQAILDSGGVAYKAGQCYQTLYPVSGASIDWYYGDRGIYSWTPELRGPTFNPPPTTILPTAQEFYAGFLWLSENYCAPDVDGSGFLDTDDYDAFVHAFEAGIPSADFDHSGFVDTDDFDAFVYAFLAGCP